MIFVNCVTVVVTTANFHCRANRQVTSQLGDHESSNSGRIIRMTTVSKSELQQSVLSHSCSQSNIHAPSLAVSWPNNCRLDIHAKKLYFFIDHNLPDLYRALKAALLSCFFSCRNLTKKKRWYRTLNNVIDVFLLEIFWKGNHVTLTLSVVKYWIF